MSFSTIIIKETMKKLFSLILAASSLLTLDLSAEQTLSIIKPDAVQDKLIGEILARFEDEDFSINAIKMTQLSKDEAAKFYAEHQGKPFFQDLITFMSSGPIVAVVLDGNDIIAKNRKLMGATDPSKAESDTIRGDLAESTTRNAVHGSDSAEAAKREIAFFFQPNEIYTRTNTKGKN